MFWNSMGQWTIVTVTKCAVSDLRVCWMLMGQHSFQFLPIPSDSGSATGKYVHLFLLCTGPVWACLASTAWVGCQMTASSIEAELGEMLSFFIYPFFFFFFFTTYMCWDRAAPLYCCIRSNQIKLLLFLTVKLLMIVSAKSSLSGRIWCPSFPYWITV